MAGLHWTAVPAILLGLLLSWSMLEALRRRVRNSYRLLMYSAILAVVAWILYTIPFVTHDYTLKPVYESTSPGLPEWLLPATAWSTGGGSLYLFTVFAAVATYLIARTARTRAYLAIAPLVPLTALVAAFLYGAFELNPRGFVGAGLNPLLKSFWLYPHPLTTFGGYALLAAATLAVALGLRSRTITVVYEIGWAMLTIGIMLGGLWSYETFGWGGYWAWDPVETSELMVWLAATTLPHVMVIAPVLTEAFASLTTSTVYLAMYVTRTGLSPLHSFAGAGAASVILLVASLLLLFYSLYRLATVQFTRTSLEWWLRGLTVFKLSMLIATVMLGVATVYVTGSLLAPSLLTAVGIEAKAPTMEAGIRFYHPVLYPVAMLLLLFAPLAFIGDRLGWRGSIAYVATVAIASIVAAVAGYIGALNLAPLSPRETNAMMAAGIVASSAALASLGYYIATKLYSLLRRKPLDVYLGIAGIHLGFALVLLGVFMGGTYSFNRFYFHSYTLKPGDSIELPGGYKLVFEGFEYGITEQPVDIYTQYVGRSATYYLAQEALLTMHMDVAHLLKEYLKGEKLLKTDKTVHTAYLLTFRVLRDAPVGDVVYHGDISIREISVIQNVTLPAKTVRNATVAILGVNLTAIMQPITEHGSGVVGTGFGVAAIARDFVVNGSSIVSVSPHTIYVVTFNPPLEIKMERLNLTINVSMARVYMWRPNRTILQFIRATLDYNGVKLKSPMVLDPSVSYYLSFVNNTGIQELLKSSVSKLLISNSLMSLVNSTNCPSVYFETFGAKIRRACVAAPTTVPENAYLKLKFAIVSPRGVERRITGLLRFEVNGEILGIHGLVSEVLHIPVGVTDLYIAIHPPTVYGDLIQQLGLSGEIPEPTYHDLAVYYLHEVFKRLKPEQRLALAALLAAGLNIDYVNKLSPQERAVFYELATLQLYLLAEHYNVSNSPLVTEGLSVDVKLVPGTQLVWAGSIVMALFAFASAAARLAVGRRG